MKYKVGDEFIVKIKEVMDSDNGTLYRSNFNTLVFDEYGLDKLQKLEDTDFLEGLKIGLTGLSCKSKEAYEKGLADAWELARKIVLDVSKGGIPERDMRSMFGEKWTVSDILKNFTPQQALAKIEAYEKSQQIKIGDVVYSSIVDSKEGICVGLGNDGQQYALIWFKEYDCPQRMSLKSLKNTGKHLDIEHLLEQIRSDE